MTDDLGMMFKRVRSAQFSFVMRWEEFKDWVRREPCARCGVAMAGTAHHFFGSIGSLKSSDVYVVPLCVECHDYHTSHPAFDPLFIEPWMKLIGRYLKERIDGDARIPES